MCSFEWPFGFDAKKYTVASRDFKEERFGINHLQDPPHGYGYFFAVTELRGARLVTQK